ncbi:MAG: hypothetical protein ABFD96_25380 [Armatimonadia bacterium]
MDFTTQSYLINGAKVPLSTLLDRTNMSINASGALFDGNLSADPPAFFTATALAAIPSGGFSVVCEWEDRDFWSGQDILVFEREVPPAPSYTAALWINALDTQVSIYDQGYEFGVTDLYRDMIVTFPTMATGVARRLGFTRSFDRLVGAGNGEAVIVDPTDANAPTWTSVGLCGWNGDSYLDADIYLRRLIIYPPLEDEDLRVRSSFGAERGKVAVAGSASGSGGGDAQVQAIGTAFTAAAAEGTGVALAQGADLKSSGASATGTGAASARVAMPNFALTATASTEVDGSTVTISAVDIGPEADDRLVVILVGFNHGSVVRTLSSATINGVAATVVGNGSSGTAGKHAVSAIRAVVPTGTAVEVVLNFSGNVSNVQLGVYRSEGMRFWDGWIQGSSGSFGSGGTAVGMDVRPYGFAVMMAVGKIYSGNADATFGFTWTGVDSAGVDLHSRLESEGRYSLASMHTTEIASRNMQMSWSDAAVGYYAIAFVSFVPTKGIGSATGSGNASAVGATV